MREREKPERMPRMATAATAGAHRNQATKSPVTHSHLERMRAIRVKVRFESSEREEGVRPTGPGWSGLTHSC
jgi:hypothetical protein